MGLFVVGADPGTARRAGVSKGERLIRLFHRRWVVPVLAALAASRGAKFVTLVHVTGASPGALRATLSELRARGWVRDNPGYGHPLRPEYILTRAGARAAERCAALEDALERLGAREIARRKWSMPVVYVTGLSPARFSTLAERLTGITDRALSLSLRGLGEADLVSRDLVDEHPPAAVYSVTARGRLLVPALGELAALNARR
jgi:DNA-binding HxlR family transcriptional regulator